MRRHTYYEVLQQSKKEQDSVYNTTLTGLTLLHVDRDIDIDLEATLDKFARLYPRRMRIKFLTVLYLCMRKIKDVVLNLHLSPNAIPRTAPEKVLCHRQLLNKFSYISLVLNNVTSLLVREVLVDKGYNGLYFCLDNQY